MSDRQDSSENSSSGDPRRNQRPDSGGDDRNPLRRPRMLSFIGLYVIIGLLAAWALREFVLPEQKSDEVTYDAFLSKLENGEIEEVTLRSSDIIATLKPTAGAAEDAKPERIVVSRLPRMDESELINQLRDAGVKFGGKIEQPSMISQMLLWFILPLLVLGVFYVFMLRRVTRGRGSPMQFGKSRAKVFDRNKEMAVTFRDVAGIDEVVGELAEVVDFLKEPQKYQGLGAQIPKGVLLVGPPGTGKTLVARAVAGESGVPFFSMSGSEFVEMFVGVGASRVRDLFEQAKDRAPCIVFIDEIDAIGRSRGGLGSMATHDEREQTLNQILSEMDGFDGTTGVIIIAATNRPEILDPALVRSGRFDRQVVVDRPDLVGREAILKVHSRKVPLAESVDLAVIARRSPGMVGADLAKVVNEAALAAARRKSPVVEQEDFEEALDRIQLGLKKTGHVMGDAEKRRVAFHESGHTLVAMSVEHAHPVHRGTIIPRSIGALGATLQLPTEDRYILTKEEILDRITVLMGGRAAEEIIFGNVSTGAQDDLQRATETARQMVTRFGMSEKLGVATYGRPNQLRFLPGMDSEDKNYSEETAQTIDQEVLGIVQSAYDRAVDILKRRRTVLDAITQRLLDVETLDRDELEKVVEQIDDAQEGAA